MRNANKSIFWLLLQLTVHLIHGQVDVTPLSQSTPSTTIVANTVGASTPTNVTFDTVVTSSSVDPSTAAAAASTIGSLSTENLSTVASTLTSATGSTTNSTQAVTEATTSASHLTSNVTSSTQTLTLSSTASSSPSAAVAVVTGTTVSPSTVTSTSSTSSENHILEPYHHHEHAHVRASAANCPDLLASHCTCGYAVYDLLEPIHTVYVTNCSSANLTDLQLLQQLPGETEVLLLSHNQLSSIDKPLLGLADGFASTADQTSDPSASAHFKALSYQFANVKVLDLSGNHLQTLSARALDGMPQLQYLDLSDNSLQITGPAFQPHLLQPVNQLKQLRLNHAFDDSNQSINFAEDLVTMLINGDLKQLQVLDLGHNHIAQLSNQFAFCALPSLQKLLLNHNRLTATFTLHLNCTPHLELLDLRNNQITHLSNETLDAFEQSGLLFHLELNGNPFQCDCALTSTLEWLHSTRIFVLGAKQFLCDSAHSNSSTGPTTLFQLNPESLCSSSGSGSSVIDHVQDAVSSANHANDQLSAHQDSSTFHWLVASLCLSAIVLASSLLFVTHRRLRLRCSTAIQQLMQKRQYSPLDKQRVRTVDTTCSEAPESSVTIHSDTSSTGHKSNVDEDVV